MKAMMIGGKGLPVRPCLQGTLLFFTCLFRLMSFSQCDSLAGFNTAEALKHISPGKDPTQSGSQVTVMKRRYLENKFYTGKQPSELVIQANDYANCDNLDFEYGSTSGWQVEGDHQLVSSGLDPFGNFPRAYPGGGAHSLMLNNNNTSGTKTKFTAKAGRLFKITKESNFINLHFAMVILNFPHDSSSAARFKISLRDSSSHVTLCSRFACYYEFEKGAVGLSNLQTSAIHGYNTVNQEFDVTYAPWQTVGMDLSPYEGKNIFLTISCDWCVFEVDWAYCYIDVDCQKPIVTTFNCVDLPYAIPIPPGIKAYSLSGPAVSPGAFLPASVSASGTYTLHSNQNPGCSELPFVYVYRVNGKPDASFSVSLQACSLSTQMEAIHRSGVSYIWKWSDSLPVMGNYHITHSYRSSGLKHVELWVKDSLGCSNGSQHTFSLAATPVVHAQPADPGRDYYDHEEQHFFAVSDPPNGQLDYYWKGPEVEQQGQAATIRQQGQYTLEAVDRGSGCRYASVFDVIFKGIVPNVFTPDNDGANDLFYFRTDKEVLFTVFDRWGRKVHESRSANGFVTWDGKDAYERTCSAGIFFYLLQPLADRDADRAATGYFALLK